MRSLCLLSVHILTLRDCCSAAHLQMIGSVQVVLRIRALDRAKVASSISSAMPHGASAKVSDIPAACGALPPSLPRHPRVPAFMLRARTLTAAYRKPMLNTASEGERHLCHPKRAARSPPQVHITGPSGAARAEDALAAARVAEKKSYADAALKAVKVSAPCGREGTWHAGPHVHLMRAQRAGQHGEIDDGHSGRAALPPLTASVSLRTCYMSPPSHLFCLLMPLTLSGVWLQMGTDEAKANPAIKAATKVNASAMAATETNQVLARSPADAEAKIVCPVGSKALKEALQEAVEATEAAPQDKRKLESTSPKRVDIKVLR